MFRAMLSVLLIWTCAQEMSVPQEAGERPLSSQPQLPAHTRPLAPAVPNTARKQHSSPCSPCRQAQRLPWTHPQSQEHASATLSNCYSTGKPSQEKTSVLSGNVHPRAAERTSNTETSNFGNKLLGVHKFSICRFTSDVFITFKKLRKKTRKRSIIYWKILLQSDQFYSKAHLAHS